MTARTRIFFTTARLTLAVGAVTAAARPCPAQATDSWPPWPQAVRTAEQTGRPIALVVTSRSNAASQEFRRALAAHAAVRSRVYPAQFTELSIEANPELARKLGITAVPTVLLYRRGASGLVLVARKSPPLEAATVVGWLAETVKAAAHLDPEVVRTLGHKTAVVQASPQQVVSQPQVVQQPQVVVQQPQVPTTLPTTPTVSTPITGPQAAPVVLQPSSAPVVIQPAPMNVVVGPAPAPVVTFVQGPSQAPQISLAAPAPATTQTNLFVAGPQVSPQQPTVASSPQQQAQVAAPQVAQAPTAPPQTVQLVSTVQAAQPLVQAQGAPGVQTALLLQQPHLLNRMLAALGRHLAQKGNPRLVMNTTTTNTPMTVQVPTTMTVQVPSVAAPQQVATVPAVQAAPAVVASPQAGCRH